MIWDISGGTLYKEYPQFCPGFLEFPSFINEVWAAGENLVRGEKALFRSRKVLMKIVSTLIERRGLPEMVAAGQIILAIHVDLAGGQIAFPNQFFQC